MRDRKKNEKTRKHTADSARFRGIKSASCIKSGRKKTLIPKVKSDEGETITSRRGVANISSHSKLYAEDQLGEEVQDPSQLGNENEHRKRKPYR